MESQTTPIQEGKDDENIPTNDTALISPRLNARAPSFKPTSSSSLSPVRPSRSSPNQTGLSDHIRTPISMFDHTTKILGDKLSNGSSATSRFDQEQWEFTKQDHGTETQRAATPLFWALSPCILGFWWWTPCWLPHLLWVPLYIY